MDALSPYQPMPKALGWLDVESDFHGEPATKDSYIVIAKDKAGQKYTVTARRGGKGPTLSVGALNNHPYDPCKAYFTLLIESDEPIPEGYQLTCRDVEDNKLYYVIGSFGIIPHVHIMSHYPK
jgi:hypothetical protein